MGDSLSEQIVIGEYQFSTKGIAHPKKHQAPQSADYKKGTPEMDLPIISKEAIRARGRKAHAEGRAREDHHMNLGAAAIVEWQAGWDEADERGRVEQLEAA